MIRNESSPILPTELTDLIIDQLACNLHDDLIPHRLYRRYVLGPLLTCSRVSRSFHNRTLYHLFSTIILTESTLSANDDRKQTISGLLDILDTTPNDTLQKTVHTLKLYTAPMRLPPKSAWGDTDQDFPTILQDIFLPRLLQTLTCIRSLHLLHRHPVPFRYSDLSDEMKSSVEGIIRGPCFSSLELVGFSVLSPSFLVRCLSLVTELEYHEYAWPFGPVQKGPAESSSTKTDADRDSLGLALTTQSRITFNLQSFIVTGYNDFIEALIGAEAFSNLKTFKHNLGEISDIFASSQIIRQASSTLETIHINNLNTHKFSEEIESCPIDFGSVTKLREIAISSFGSVESQGGTRVLQALHQVLSPQVTVSSDRPIEILRLDIRWGSATFATAADLFKRTDLGWDQLDSLLANSTLFQHLKVFEVRVGMIIANDGATSFDVGQLKRELSQSTANLFRTLSTSRRVTLSILVDYPTLI